MILLNLIRRYPNIILCCLAILSIIVAAVQFLPTEEDYIRNLENEYYTIAKIISFGDSLKGLDLLEAFLAKQMPQLLYNKAILRYADVVVNVSRKHYFQGEYRIGHADKLLRFAQARGEDRAIVKKSRQRLAELAADNMLIDFAINLYNRIISDEGDKDEIVLAKIALESRAALQLNDKQKKDSIAKDLLKKIDDFVLTQPLLQESALGLKLKVLREHLRHNEVKKEYLGLKDRYPTNYEMLLEYCKSLYKLGEKDEALNKIELVYKEAKSVKIINESIFMKAEILRKNTDLAANDIFKSLDKSDLHAESKISRGRFLLQFDVKKGLELIKEGLVTLKSQYNLKELEVDLDEVRDELKSRTANEADPYILMSIESAFSELSRFYADDIYYWNSLAEVNKALAISLENKSVMEKSRGEHENASRFQQESNRIFFSASQYFKKMSNLPSTKREGRLTGLENAADCLRRGGFHIQAAEIYRELSVIVSSKVKPQFIREEAISMKTARQYEEALRLFREFLREYPSDALSDDVLIERGKIYMELGRFSEAAADFTSVRDHARSLITPMIPNPVDIEKATRRILWADSLFFGASANLLAYQLLKSQGKLSEAMSNLKDAMDQIEEYIKRYVDEPIGKNAVIFPASAIVISATISLEQKDLSKAKKLLEKCVSIEKVAESDDEKIAMLKAHFMLAEVEYLQSNLHENYFEAARLFETAYRKFASSHFKIWGLIGKAKSYYKLRNFEDARQELIKADEILSRSSDSVEKYPKLFEHWKNEIVLLNKLLEEGKQ